MKLRKSLVFVLMLILVLGVFAGCSNDDPEDTGQDKDKSSEDQNNEESNTSSSVNAEGYPIVDEPITLSMFSTKTATDADFAKMSLFKLMKDKTNVHFEFTTPPSAALEQKKKLVMASGEYPDIFMLARLKPSEEVQYGSTGAFIPLEGLLEKYAPNFQKLTEAYPEVIPSITAPDGHIYSLPYVTEGPRAKMALRWVNGKWLNNLGITEMPQTTEEFTQLLKKFKTEDANGNGKEDELPLSFPDPALTNINKFMLPAFGIVSNQKSYPGIYADDNGKVHYAYTQDEYKQMLMYMNKLWEEDLLDHAIFSQTNQQYFASGSAGNIGVFPGATPFGALRSQSLEEMKTAKILPPLTSSINDKKIIQGSIPIRRGAFALSNANKHPEASIRWADFFYSEKGSKIAQIGVEGEQWKWTNEEKTEYKLIVPEGKSNAKVRGEGTPEVGWGDMPAWIRTEFIKKKNPDGLSAWTDQAARPMLEYRKVPFPLVYLKTEEQQQITTIRSNLDSYYQQMAAKFIAGDKSFDEWDDFVNTIKEMGSEKMVDVYQAAYDRYQAVK